MELKQNIMIDSNMKKLIDNNTLSVIDVVKLSVANYLSEFFSTSKIYINPVEQGCKFPALFVDFYDISKQRKLAYTSQYEIGINISYIEQKPTNTTLHNAIFVLMQNLTDIEDYPIYNLKSDITDDIVNVTGIIKINEQNIVDAEIIMHTPQVIKNEPLINKIERVIK